MHELSASRRLDYRQRSSTRCLPGRALRLVIGRPASLRTRILKPRFCGSEGALDIERLCQAAGLALVPQLPEAFDVFLAKFAFELSIPNGLTCGCIFTGFNGSFEGGALLSGQGNADFLDIRHDTSPIVNWRKHCYRVARSSIEKYRCRITTRSGQRTQHRRGQPICLEPHDRCSFFMQI